MKSPAPEARPVGYGRQTRRNGSLELTVSPFGALRYVERHPGNAPVAARLSPRYEPLVGLGARRAACPGRSGLSDTGVPVVGRAVCGIRAWLSGELEAFEPKQRRPLAEALELLALVGSSSDADRPAAR